MTTSGSGRPMLGVACKASGYNEEAEKTASLADRSLPRIGATMMLRPAQVAAVSFLLLAATAHAAVCFVDPAGADRNPGTEDRPWKTIQRAADAAKPGDRVMVRKGTYTERVQLNASGKPDLPITFEAAGEVIVKGPASLQHWEAIVDIRKKTHLVIKGFRVQDSNWFGIGIHNSQHILVQNCATANTQASGIYARDSEQIVVEGNDVSMACLYEGDKGGSQECISIASVKGFRVVGNKVHDTTGKKHGGEGIDAKESAQDGVIESNTVWNLPRLGIYVDSWNGLAKGLVVRKNVVHDCSCGIAVSSEDGGTVQDLTIANNLIYNNRERGIVISAWEKNGPKRNIVIVNNTAVGNGSRQANWGSGIAIEKTDATGVVIRNNICSRNVGNQILDESGHGPAVDHNLLDGGRKGANDTKGEAAVRGDPLFVDAAKADFHLLSNSPAINAGTEKLAPTDDFDGFPRPYGPAFDIGAYEAHPEGAKPGAAKPKVTTPAEFR
ncbi:MAG: right-handed parallel beta-helix repeat-containing protein [Planctomycetota bacterium]|nr:right-handed parallel beta-helix repeat-containing protein [Planctomycetota bacterium]